MGDLNINILLAVVGIAVLFKMADGYKKGFVKEIISLVSLAVLSVVAALVAYGAGSYYDGKFFHVAVVVILLGLLGIAHHLLRVVLFSAKMVTKLPVLHFGDKLLGMVFGVFEVVMILWTVYAFVMMMETGALGQLILSYTEDSPILLWLYEHNYLAHWIETMLKEIGVAAMV